MRKACQTDLSDAEWAYIEPHLPAPKPGGRPRVHTVREILDSVFYVVRGGCAWRLLPHYFRLWCIDGTWQRLHEALHKRARVRLGRDPEPSAAIVDSQSVKTTGVGGDASRTLTVSSLTGSGTSTVTVTASDGDLEGSVLVRVIAGSAANNTLSGSANADMIFARKGNDTASGQGANDLLCGGNGNDKLTGGLGADHLGGGSGTDTATDFNAGESYSVLR